MIALIVGGGVWLVNRDDDSSPSASSGTEADERTRDHRFLRDDVDQRAERELPARSCSTPRRTTATSTPTASSRWATVAMSPMRAKQGYVYLCRAPGGGGGASSRGPWFVNNNTEYDVNKKVAVEGRVEWDGNYTMTVERRRRTITTNDVPDDHTTGVFPVQPTTRRTSTTATRTASRSSRSRTR